MASRVLTGALAAVLAVALLWGTCAACWPAQAQKSAANGCCDEAGKCKRPERPVLKRCPAATAAADSYTPQAPVLVGHVEPVVGEMPRLDPVAPVVVVRRAGESPPELFLQNASFRI